ncbi:amino acid adenylation domain-containing protein [Micromonospora pisi]|uniref:Amino acid adenylation domain-containing protein n=1 Tax=Micromonospora pisi TaxID=589240 RepID=A0A495JBD7_9ACTN|nr:non-ribosomal peptide synthetase [Micromonospora pisi]RKR86143.1 amino acid adenylation domain-containing protein [Micromonospora pisi]
MNKTSTTYAQHAVWFTEQAGVAGGTYQLALGIRFGADLDQSALAEACTAVIDRHEVLSTAVEPDRDGVPALVPAAEKISVRHGELTDDRLSTELTRPFDLRQGPLARFTLLTSPTRGLLLVTAHHLVFDGMSKDVLLADLAAAYEAAVAGRPVDLGPAADPYAGDAAAEQERVTAELEPARRFWDSRWSPPGGVVLPGLIRVPTSAEPGQSREFTLAPELVHGLDRVTREIGVTRFELLLAVVHTLLDRYGNQDLPVGVGMSTRTARSAGRVGLFVNELPTYPPDPSGSFRDYAHAVRTGLREAYRFRHVPLARAVNGLRPAPALTPVSVGYRRRAAAPEFAGAATEVVWSLFNGTARNALHVQVVDGSDAVTVSLQHSPAAIDGAAVDRIGAHLRTVLAAVLDDPDRPMVTLPLLPPDEWAGLVDDGNATARDYPVEATVPELFTARVRRHPEAVAVVDRDRRLTYAELDAVSGRLAALLGQRGVGAGALVAIALDRSWQAVAALLAVLRLGAAYVPVDPAYPPSRQAMLLDDADPALVVTTAPVAARLDPRTPVFVVDDLDAGIEPDGIVTGQAAPVGPDDLAYVLHTSGSTGRPKGVMVRHGALANLLFGLGDLLGAGPAHRWLGLTSLSFDISGVEIFLPLVTGGSVVVASGTHAADGPAVCRLIREQRVTHVQATPSGWRILLDAGFGGPDAGGPDADSPDVGSPESGGIVALAGGEALPLPLARELRARVARLVNGYGPTEATIYATAADLPEGPQRVTIGRPLPNTRAYVLDARMRPVPVGVPGELYLGGPGVASGYLRQPELTGERFVPDPFAPAGSGGSAGRLYRTGDLVRRLPDGRFDFIGRADQQVKIRGHRVELGEIEAGLAAHPAVVAAAVVLRGDATEATLIGYVVPAGPPPEPGALRTHLARTLPAAMLPNTWVFLDRLPLTANGKLDRSALPDPPPDRILVPGPPTTPVEDDVVRRIRSIWQDVLQISDIGLDEDLFDLGGHSLTITRISGRIHQHLGVEVPLEVFFDTPTIAEIAEFVRDSGGGR